MVHNVNQRVLLHLVFVQNFSKTLSLLSLFKPVGVLSGLLARTNSDNGPKSSMRYKQQTETKKEDTMITIVCQQYNGTLDLSI